MGFNYDRWYHIYNRGVDKRDIFIDDNDFGRFIRSTREFNSTEPIGSLYEKDVRKYFDKKNNMPGAKGIANPLGVYDSFNDDSFNESGKKLVEFVCYCLIPNHYHFLLRQLVEGGISEFMRKLGIGYTNYFNKKYNRSGVLFQGKFKAAEVKNYSRSLKLIVYINCNIQVHRLDLAVNWPWSSFFDYISKRFGTLCNKEYIEGEFRSTIEFNDFCFQVLPDIIEEKELRASLLE